MIKLNQMKYEVCDANAKLLSKSEIESLMLQLPDWKVMEDSGTQKLHRTYSTQNYSKSISFTNAIAQLAESVNHHPVIITEYACVTIQWWSHIIKGLHINDFIVAAQSDNLF